MSNGILPDMCKASNEVALDYCACSLAFAKIRACSTSQHSKGFAPKTGKLYRLLLLYTFPARHYLSFVAQTLSVVPCISESFAALLTVRSCPVFAR